MTEIIARDFYARLDAIEDELLAIEASLAFGQDPDAYIIAMIHVALAADLPGLISRVYENRTAESEALTRRHFVIFTDSVSGLNLDDVERSNVYASLIAATGSLYRDILQEYS